MAIRKIAIVARNISGKTGTSNTIIKQARWLAEKNWDVTLIGSRISKTAVSHPHIHCRYIPDIKIGGYIKHRLFAAWAGFSTRNNKFSIIHGHGDMLSQDILSLHNCIHKTHEAINKNSGPSKSGAAKIHAQQLSKQKFQFLIANSRLMKDDLINRYQIPDEKITVIYPGHDPGQFNTKDKETARNEVCKKLQIPSNNFIIGFLSSGDFKKRNLTILLKSVALLPKNGRVAYKCIVTGYDKSIPEYITLSKQLGIADSVIFAGSQHDTAPYFKSFDVYVHPAHFEEFGQTVQEALACGVPTITTSTTGAHELFTDEAKDFILHNPEDAHKLSSMILYLMKNPIQQKKLGQSLPPMVSHNTWETNFTKVSAVYDRLKGT